MPRKPHLKTRAEARALFDHTGKSIAAWARSHDVSAELAYQVMTGRKKGIRGEAHKIAVLLGIKAGVITD